MRKSKAPLQEVEVSGAVEEPLAQRAPEQKVVNLTSQRRIAYLERKCVSECAAVDELATVKQGVYKRDKDGNVEIRDGVPVIEQRMIMARDAIKLKYDKLIADARAGKL